ncbi:MAG: ankyrin repeat domain-containing protein, partial [Planctomycetota bacterium]
MGVERLVRALEEVLGWVKYGWSFDIHRAAEKGDLTGVKWILSKRPEFASLLDRGGETVLHKAAGNGWRQIVEVLVANGAEVNAVSHKGHTPLHRAARGHKGTVEVLLALGADVHAESNKGHTALHSAAARGQREIAEVLVGAGSDANAKDKCGRTLL